MLRLIALLIGLMLSGAVALVVSRRRELRTENRLDSLLSRESIFFVNNLLLVVDLLISPQLDLSLLRALTGFVGVSLLIYGLVWDGA